LKYAIVGAVFKQNEKKSGNQMTQIVLNFSKLFVATDFRTTAF